MKVKKIKGATVSQAGNLSQSTNESIAANGHISRGVKIDRCTEVSVSNGHLSSKPNMTATTKVPQSHIGKKPETGTAGVIKRCGECRHGHVLAGRQNTCESCQSSAAVRHGSVEPHADSLPDRPAKEAMYGYGTVTSWMKRLESFVSDYCHWIVFVCTLVFRVCYVSNTDNWWILHPDEVYQTVEVAFSELNGYGFRPYEYTAPPSDISLDFENRKLEFQLGMYSLRSFLLPRIIALVMWGAGVINLETSPYLVAKVFHASVTSLLPLVVFYLSRALNFTKRTSQVSGVLASCSVSLNMLGTHALLNSFLSPFVFLSCIPLVTKIQQHQGRPLQTSELVRKTNNIEAKDQNSNSPLCLPLQRTSNQNGQVQNGHLKNGQVQNGHLQNGHVKNRQVQNGQVQNGHLQNGHVQNEQVQKGHLVNGHLSNGHPCHVVSNSLKGTHGRWKSQNRSAIIDSLKEYNLSNGGSSLTNGNLSQFLEKTTTTTPETICVLKELTSGLVLALCTYVRIDVILVPLLLTTALCQFRCLKMLTTVFALKLYVVGFVSGILIGGYCDHMSYGTWFISPYQWLTFNVFTNRSSVTFGEQPSTYYLNNLLWPDFLHFVLAFILFMDFTLSFDLPRRYLGYKLSNDGKTDSGGAIFLAFTISVLVYSLTGHKELRFVHNCYVLLYILYARAIDRVNSLVIKSVEHFQTFTSFYTVAFVLVFLSNQIYSFVSMPGDSSCHVNKCLHFLRGQSDVTGIYIDASIHKVGGYSILGHDVPIICLNNYEIVEYDRASRQGLLNHRFPGRYSNSSLVQFGEIRDFISLHNTPYLLKVLVLKTQYNYLVMDVDRPFVNVGYTEVYRSGIFKVLKRNFDAASEAALKDIANRIPLGSNATVLEYEGQRLIQHGLYETAIQKLLLSNKLDPAREGPYQLLAHTYISLGRGEVGERILQECGSQISRAICRRQYVPVQLQGTRLLDRPEPALTLRM